MGVRNTEHSLEKEEYVEDIAKVILSEFSTNKALLAKRRAFQKYNMDAIFDSIEKMYYAEATDIPSVQVPQTEAHQLQVSPEGGDATRRAVPVRQGLPTTKEEKETHKE